MYGRGLEGDIYQFAEWDVFDDPDWMIPEALALRESVRVMMMFLDMLL